MPGSDLESWVKERGGGSRGQSLLSRNNLAFFVVRCTADAVVRNWYQRNGRRRWGGGIK